MWIPSQGNLCCLRNPAHSQCLNATVPQGMMKAETRALWELLFTDFTQFQDFRTFKAERGGTGPEFKHIESGAGLW